MADLLSNIESGYAATVGVGSDRYPATVIEVKRYKSGALKGAVSEITVQEDVAHLVSGSEADGSAQYNYTTNENGEVTTFRPRKNRLVWKSTGGRVLYLGARRRYYDPHI